MRKLEEKSFKIKKFTHFITRFLLSHDVYIFICLLNSALYLEKIEWSASTSISSEKDQ